MVKARVTYAHADDLPFYAYLPVQALYQVKSPRELITLTGDNDGVVGDYFFDVETGLGLSSTLATPGFYMMMLLSEINYDFATHQAFAEDDGPHSAYRASQMAGRMEWPISQFYLFEERVISRYRQSVRTDLTLSLQNIATGQSFQGDYTSWFDGENRQFWIAPIGVTTAATTTTLTTNGTHAFYWIPPGDMTRNTIRVWDWDLTRRDPVDSDTVFASDGLPGDWGFTRLQLDPNGFAREMTVQSPSMSFAVDSSTALPSSKTNYVTGRAYYLETMGHAIPGSSSRRDLGLMKMTAPKTITLKGTPVTKTVKLTLQNHGTQSETISDATALAQLVTLTVNSLGACANPPATIISPTVFPVTLAPKKKLTMTFAVSYGCANDPAPTTKIEAHRDYSYLAELHGTADADAHDDACPHNAPPAGIDPVNSKIKDQGCGGKRADKTLGADVLTDVIIK